MNIGLGLWAAIIGATNGAITMGLLLKGSGVPDTGLGSDTDWYIDLATANLYQKDGATWTLFQSFVAVAGAVDDIQVHALGGGLKALSPGTVGNTIRNVGGVWTSTADGAGREITTFDLETINDDGETVAESIDISEFEDGIYAFTLRIRGDAGPLATVVHGIMLERTIMIGIRDGETASFSDVVTSINETIPNNVVLDTGDAWFDDTIGSDTVDVMVQGEAHTTVNWSGEVEMRLATAGDGVGWHQSDFFDPGSLTLTGWWRGDFASSPWAGSDSLGNSGERVLSEATNPPASANSALSTYDAADFDGTNDVLRATTTAATTWASYITATAFTTTVLFYADAADADAGDANSYDNPCLYCDDTNGGFGLAFSDSGLRAWQYVADWSSVELACSTGAWHVAQVRYNGTTLQTRVDRGSWSNQTRGNVSAGSLGTQPRIGTSYTGAKKFNGKIMELMICASALSDGNCDNIVDYINDRYGTAY